MTLHILGHCGPFHKSKKLFLFLKKKKVKTNHILINDGPLVDDEHL